MSIKFDVVVVGAGTAGCLTSMTSSKKGLDVCLIESKPLGRVGDKVCGDAVGHHHFAELGLDPPKGEELDCKIQGIEIFSPDMESCFRIEGEGVSGYMIDRHAFGQRLLKLCLNERVAIKPETVAVSPVIKKGYVRGITVHDKRENRIYDIYGKVTVDASGVSAILRKKLPRDLDVEGNIAPSDLMACYREIRGNCELDAPYCQIFLNQEIAPGGYYWIFPKKEGKVNTGLGVQAKRDGIKPRQMFEKVLSSKSLAGSTLIEGGGGFVPTRRPLDSLVANGIVFIGDAAFLANPIHGGGIGPSMMSGRMAADTIVDAAERGDFSRESLWSYPQKYNRRYGAKQAVLDIFRIFLQSTENEELNYGMKHRLVKEEDILKASLQGELKLSITDKAERVFKGLRKLKFLTRLRETSQKMKRMKRLYVDYPESKAFKVWRRQVHQLYV